MNAENADHTQKSLWIAKTKPQKITNKKIS